MNPLRSFRAPLVIMLLVGAGLAISGCTINATDPMLLVVQTPRVGDTAFYRGSDGSTITAKVLGPATRADPWLNPVPVLLLEYVYQAPDLRFSPYRFEEAVDHAGRIVQQAADCGYPLHPDNEQGACKDNRGAAYFRGWGWPGGLGVAPFWFDARIPATMDLPGRIPGQERTLAIAVADGAPSCRTLTYTGPTDAVLIVVPVMVANGHATICPGHAWPSEFQSSVPWNKAYTLDDVVTYTLENHTAGAGAPVEAPPRVERPHNSSRFEFLELGEPLYRDPRPDDLPFPPQEAIQVASDQDPRVRDFLAEHPDAVPITAGYIQTRTQDGGPLIGGNEQRGIRTIHLADGSGPCLRFVIERTAHNGSKIPTDDDFTSYDLQEVNSCDNEEVVIDLGNVSRRQVSYASVARWGSSFVGTPPLLGSVGYAHRAVPIVWADVSVGPHYEWNRDGYEVIVTLDDPNRQDDGSVFFIIFPYWIYVDGPSGAINRIDVPRDKMPLTGG